MTFAMAMRGKRSIWMIADRRLTFPDRTSDDACKIIGIKGSDGEALIGYSGLGRSSRGTEPSIWMTDILASLPNGSLEDYIVSLFNSMATEMPVHLSTLGGSHAQNVIVSALVEGKPLLYSMGILAGADGRISRKSITRYEVERNGPDHPRFAMVGSGMRYVQRWRDKWYRPTLKMLDKFERNETSAVSVADKLADINVRVSREDPMVSQESIVMWRHDGGSHQFYSGLQRIADDKPIPMIFNGMDVQKLAQAHMLGMQPSIEAFKRGEDFDGDPDPDVINAELKRLFGLPKRKL
jgi:hypothetical protein